MYIKSMADVHHIILVDQPQEYILWLLEFLKILIMDYRLSL